MKERDTSQCLVLKHFFLSWSKHSDSFLILLSKLGGFQGGHLLQRGLKAELRPNSGATWLISTKENLKLRAYQMDT